MSGHQITWECAQCHSPQGKVNPSPGDPLLHSCPKAVFKDKESVDEAIGEC